MKKPLFIGLLILGPLLLSRCSKDEGSPPTPPSDKTLTISNLVYNPQVVPIKNNTDRFFISGTIDFKNADGGIASLRLTNSGGADITVPVQGMSQSSGTLAGSFEFAMPPAPASYTFQIWVIDGKGNASNKLSGSVNIIIDNSATKWTEFNIGSTFLQYRVIWGNDEYIAVGEAGLIYTAINPVIWTTQNSGTNNRLHGIAWTGKHYIVVGEYNTILYSNDGIDWTTITTSPDNDKQWFDVAWSGQRFVTVGEDLTNNSTAIKTSEDGINWTSNPFVIARGSFASIVWSGTQFVAVGQVPDAAMLMIATSPDGLNWTDRSIPYSLGWKLYDVAWSGDHFVTVGGGVSATSPDGINWSTKDIPVEWALSGVITAGNKYVAAGAGIYTSTDGLNWSKTYPSEILYPLRSIAWNGLQYVAVGKQMMVLVSP
jgi:hypothetical protein